jgi:hypothetical protein
MAPRQARKLKEEEAEEVAMDTLPSSSDSDSSSDDEQSATTAKGRKALMAAYSGRKGFIKNTKGSSKVANKETSEVQPFRNKQRVLLLCSRGIIHR